MRAGVVAVVVAATALVAPAASAVAAPQQILRVWGTNLSGQLTFNVQHVVQTVGVIDLPDVNQFHEVAASVSGHSLGIDANNRVQSWGDNFRNELGRLGGNSDIPTLVSGPTNIIDIAAGNRFSLAVSASGSVWAWGDNTFGQLGDGGSATPHHVAQQIFGLTGVVDVEASGNFALARRTDGTVWGWGQSHNGQTGSPVTAVTTPRQIGGLNGIVDIAAGTAHGLAVRNDGKVLSWGYGNFGQLGDGTSQNRAVPFQVPVPGTVKSVAAGNYHSLALRPDGKLYSWGYNGVGQLGINSSNPVSASTPQLVVTSLIPHTIVDIEAGAYNTYARDAQNNLWSCGTNLWGQLGFSDPNISARYRLGGLGAPNFRRISAGDKHVLALTERQ